METVVNFDFFMQLIKKNWQLLVGFAVAGVVLALGITFFVMTPKYQSSIQILVNRDSKSAANQYAGQQADVQMITTYKELIGNPVILEPAQEQLEDGYGIVRSMAQLKKAVKVTSTANSQVFSIAVKDRNAKSSARIADQVAASFKRQVKKIIKVNNVTIVAPAETPKTPVSPQKWLNLLVGLVVGLGMGVLTAGIRIATDRHVKDVTFITEELDLISLGIVNHQRQYSVRKQLQKIRQHAEDYLADSHDVKSARRV